MPRRRRHRKRWSVQDFDNYISGKIGDAYLEMKRIILGAEYLVKLHHGTGYRWTNPNTLEKGASIVGWYPANRRPRSDESQFESYHKAQAEYAARPKPEPVPEPVPENKKLLPFLRRPPLRHMRRSVSRNLTPDSRAA